MRIHRGVSMLAAVVTLAGVGPHRPPTRLTARPPAVEASHRSRQSSTARRAQPTGC